MKIKRITLIAFLAISLSACTHAPVTKQLPPQASHVGVDQAVAAVHASQQHAEAQVKDIESKITDPVLKQEVVDLHSTITDQGDQISLLTGKVAWFEGQYTQTYTLTVDLNSKLDVANATISKKDAELKDAIAGKSFWRKRAQVLLYFLALVGAWKFYGTAQKMCVTPVPNLWESLIIPAAAALLGAAVGYGLGLYVLGWLAQFLP